MATLILDIQPELIEVINKVAEKRNQSVSKIAEELFRNEADKELSDYDVKGKLSKYPEWVQRLVIADKPTPDFDHKADYRKHLDEKYGL